MPQIRLHDADDVQGAQPCTTLRKFPEFLDAAVGVGYVRFCNGGHCQWGCDGALPQVTAGTAAGGPCAVRSTITLSVGVAIPEPPGYIRNHGK